MLTSCLGGDLPPRFEFSGKTPLQRGDVVLLCSDGVWGPLADDVPLADLSDRDAVKAAPGLLNRIEAAAGPGRDNLSLILLAWAEDARVAPGPATAPTWTKEDFNRTVNTTHTKLHAKEPT
jgi:serine/threonine protein phosphatase PrpC